MDGSRQSGDVRQLCTASLVMHPRKYSNAPETYTDIRSARVHLIQPTTHAELSLTGGIKFRLRCEASVLIAQRRHVSGARSSGALPGLFRIQHPLREGRPRAPLEKRVNYITKSQQVQRRGPRH